MKKLKYVLIALAVIVLGVAGYIVYELKFKSYDTADAEVDALLEDSYELTLPDGSTILVDKEGNIVDKADQSVEGNSGGTVPADSSDTNSTEADKKPEGSTGESTGTNSTIPTSTNQSKPNRTTSPNEKATVSTIKAQYTPTFAMIENQARDRINSLISQAFNEYSSKKKNGESISYGYFYRKYMGAATAIESATDKTVNVAIGLVEKDLQANGFDKSYAQTFAEDYKTTKKALRDELMDKALDFR